MKIFTIGFTNKNAKGFYETLRQSDCKHIVDVRVNPNSQLSRFAHGKDLEFLVQEILGYKYKHIVQLAPEKEMVSAYQSERKRLKAKEYEEKLQESWKRYEKNFLDLIRERQIEMIPKEAIANGCLLCSEHEPHLCHRRLVAEYLKKQWDKEGYNIEIIHLPLGVESSLQPK